MFVVLLVVVLLVVAILVVALLIVVVVVSSVDMVDLSRWDPGWEVSKFLIQSFRLILPSISKRQ